MIQNPDNVAMQGELMRALSNLGKFEEASNLGKEILSKNENDIFALYEMARIERRTDNLEQEKNYLEKILEITSDEQEQVIIMRLGKVNRILQKRQQYKEQKGTEQQTYENSIEGQQEKFAKEQMEKENMYTKETQEEYMDKLAKAFIAGDIKKEDLKSIWQKLQQYPDKTKSIIFMLDLYSKITEYYIIPIKTLEVYLEKAKTLTPEEYDKIMKEIVRYRNCIKLQDKKQEDDIEK